jgi:hypothetical protein
LLHLIFFLAEFVELLLFDLELLLEKRVKFFHATAVIELHFLHDLSVIIFLLSFKRLQVLILRIELIELLTLAGLHLRNFGFVEILLSSQGRLNGIVLFFHVQLEFFLLLSPLVHHLLFDKHDIGKTLVNYLEVCPSPTE